MSANRPTVRRLLQVAAASVLLLAACYGIWLAAQPPSPPSLQARVATVTSGLRCPSCNGQSVASSESDLARQMRQVTAEQLAAGRTPAQIRTWFAERYGDDVLLDPPRHGFGLAAHVLPFALVGVAGLLVARRIGGRRGVATGMAIAIGIGGVLLLTGGLGPATPSGSGTWSPPPAPASPAASGESEVIRSALADLQAGRADQAEQQARRAIATARTDSRDYQDGLLVVGLAQRQRKEPEATLTLQRFLRIAPNHPAAAMVRRLLAGG